MPTGDLMRVARCISKLEKWIDKRRRKGLECTELEEATTLLTQYMNVLRASEAIIREAK